MHKTTKLLFSLCMLILLFCLGILIADKQSLRTKIVRLHVVANSNSIQDQAEKLAVRDAVMCQLEAYFNGVNNITAAKELLRENLWKINAVANNALSDMGSENDAIVTLASEKFDCREYDTFSLPSGVYESLRIQIGTGQGKNWWCVVFPALCAPANNENFKETAVSGGLDPCLAQTLSNEPSYEFRFFLLDCIGKFENILYFS